MGVRSSVRIHVCVQIREVETPWIRMPIEVLSMLMRAQRFQITTGILYAFERFHIVCASGGELVGMSRLHGIP
jgi:hypothetical protein